MIKLVTILKEMAISNAWSGEKEKLGAETDTVIEASTAMGLDNPVLWRGTRGIPVPGKKGRDVLSHIMRITPRETSAFRGGTENAIKVLQSLEINYPIFAHFDRTSTKIFGTPCVLVFEQPYTMYQSSEINDIMADTEGLTQQELQNAATSYNKIPNKPLFGNNEIIVNATNYWAIPCGDEIKTYGDLVDLLESYKTKFA
jgi:hypothetical protein